MKKSGFGGEQEEEKSVWFHRKKCLVSCIRGSHKILTSSNYFRYLFYATSEVFPDMRTLTTFLYEIQKEKKARQMVK